MLATINLRLLCSSVSVKITKRLLRRTDFSDTWLKIARRCWTLLELSCIPLRAGGKSTDQKQYDVLGSDANTCF